VEVRRMEGIYAITPDNTKGRAFLFQLGMNPMASTRDELAQLAKEIKGLRSDFLLPAGDRLVIVAGSGPHRPTSAHHPWLIPSGEVRGVSSSVPHFWFALRKMQTSGCWKCETQRTSSIQSQVEGTMKLALFGHFTYPTEARGHTRYRVGQKKWDIVLSHETVLATF